MLAWGGRPARRPGPPSKVLAGIGFTAERRFHRYLRRTPLIDQLFGSAVSSTEHQEGS